jgi:hypothetical protein
MGKMGKKTINTRATSSLRRRLGGAFLRLRGRARRRRRRWRRR